MKIDQLILGQTLVTNAGESYAQSKTHHKIYQDILDSDRIAVLDWLNNEYKPFLLRIGYDIPETHMFDIEFKPNPDAQREKALLLLDRGLEIDPEVIEQIFDIPVNGYQTQTTPQETLNVPEPEMA